MRVGTSPIPRARSWLVNAGIDPSPYDDSEPDMLDRLVDLLEEEKFYPDKITITPFDDRKHTDRRFYSLASSYAIGRGLPCRREMKIWN